MIARTIRYGLLCLGLVVGTPASQSVCAAMGGMADSHSEQADQPMEHCHDAPTPNRGDEDSGHGCCDGGSVSGCLMTNTACCSISEQTIPAKVSVEIQLARPDLQPVLSSFKPPGPPVVRQSFKLPHVESIDRLSLHSVFLI